MFLTSLRIQTGNLTCRELLHGVFSLRCTSAAGILGEGSELWTAPGTWSVNS